MRLQVLIVAAVLSSGTFVQITKAEDPDAPVASQSGRFQIIMNPHVRADTFLLDTQTGRIWQRAQYSELNGDPDAWVIMDRLDDADQMMAWARRKGVKPTPVPAPASKGTAPTIQRH